jgi:hypothetical protein
MWILQYFTENDVHHSYFYGKILSVENNIIKKRRKQMLRALNENEYRKEIGIEGYEEKIENKEIMNIFELVIASYPYVSEDILNLMSESCETVINQVLLALFNNAAMNEPLEKVNISFIFNTLADFCKMYCDGRNILNGREVLFEEFQKVTATYLDTWIKDAGGVVEYSKGILSIEVSVFNGFYKNGKFNYLINRR